MGGVGAEPNAGGDGGPAPEAVQGPVLGLPPRQEQRRGEEQVRVPVSHEPKGCLLEVRRRARRTSLRLAIHPLTHRFWNVAWLPDEFSWIAYSLPAPTGPAGLLCPEALQASPRANRFPPCSARGGP